MDPLVLEMPPAVCMFLRWSPQTTSHGGRRGTTVPQEAAPRAPRPTRANGVGSAVVLGWFQPWPPSMNGTTWR